MEEAGKEQAPKTDTQSGFSLDQRIPQPPLPSQQSGRLIWWCQVILWISPGPAWAMIGYGFAWLGFDHFIFALGVAMLCAFGIGYCDAFLSPAVRKKDHLPAAKEALWHASAFGLLQIFIAPLTLVALGMFLYLVSAAL